MSDSLPSETPDSDAMPVDPPVADSQEPTPAAKSKWKAPVAVVVLLVALATFYMRNPETRALALNTISSAWDSADSMINPEPVRDMNLLAEAATYWRARDWPNIVSSYAALVDAEPENYGAWNRLATAHHTLEDYEAAIEANRQATNGTTYASNAWYNMACEFALLGRPDDAFDALDRSLRSGYMNISHLNTDPDLTSLHDDERFDFPVPPTEESFTFADGATISYGLTLPRDFDPEKTYPALLGLNGGSQGVGPMRGGLRSFWGMQAIYRDWIVVSPTAPGSKNYYVGDGYLYLEEFVEFIKSQYRIEGDKFHVAGYSHGGSSTFRVATHFPQHFASVTGFPGYAIPGEDFDLLENLKGMKIHIIYGSEDKGPAEKYSHETYDRLRELKYDVTLTAFEGEPHIPPSMLADRFMEHMDTIRQEILAANEPGS